jgi:hypothetical protein
MSCPRQSSNSLLPRTLELTLLNVKQSKLQVTSVSVKCQIYRGPKSYVKSIQKSKNHQRRIFLDNYYRQRCLV